ncbi:MAG TPA: bifunctional DNA primase/polymerase, partial [Nitrososphaeraceae archaeon]|nr:bifunctional DNA primase/polymerase [Nitrososphaeraceae archaeon]
MQTLSKEEFLVMVVHDDDNISLEKITQWADFWHYEIGPNVIPANTKEKNTFVGWSEYQEKSISDEVHESRKQSGYYNNGLAIMTGKLWRGPYAGKYLVAIDLDNKKAIEDFCGSELEYLKQHTLVEQTSNPNKMHIYFIVDREIPNKTSDKVDISKSEKIKANEIPALEVKSNSKGIMFCSNSPHKNAGNYRIIGTLKPIVFE